MKKNRLFLFSLITFLGWNNIGSAQSLFKDLALGNNISSNPEQLTNVNGTMYFITNAQPNYNHQLWKSDGTAANTVIVKDNIINSNVGNVVYMRGSIGNTLYFSVNKLGITAGDTTRLWKTDGTAPVLLATLSHPGGGYPNYFTPAGSKIFFSMSKNNGRELWVSDGTAAGTQEVMDLNPGSIGSYKYGGVVDAPMIAFNGKVYFSGNVTANTNELYSSDGTAAGTTLVKAGVTDPGNFIVYKNELYFGANGGAELWKTDGTSNGTVKVATTPFTTATIFKNELYYSPSGKLWKSDGTTGGTVWLKDSVGTISGATSTHFFTSYMRSLSSAPWYTMYYWKSDGTASGTVRVADSIGKGASFQVLNNKMYNTAPSSGFNSSLWETDGTPAGTKNLLTGIPAIPHVFNNTLFFSNFTMAEGYELWSLAGGGPVAINTLSNADGFKLFPNPSTGRLQISIETKPQTEPTLLKVTDLLGKEVYSEKLPANASNYTIDLSHLQNGIYLLHGNNITPQKLIIQK
jgi:ELWxxDGT repeat protein